MTNIVAIQEEIKKELGNKKVLEALVATTFKGLAVPQVYMAIQEGMMRGFEFKDFLEKNVYAIPFKGAYSLVTSIDYARKKGMRSGIVGKSAPVYTYKEDGKIDSCTITVKRKVNNYVGEYTATVFFDEYYKAGKNGYPSLWDSKPKTMIAKVAEMHALRTACPEELSQVYTEEDYEQEQSLQENKISEEIIDKVNKAETLEQLKTIYKENEGLGKEFSKMVADKKKLLIESQNEKA